MAVISLTYASFTAFEPLGGSCCAISPILARVGIIIFRVLTVSFVFIGWRQYFISSVRRQNAASAISGYPGFAFVQARG